MFLIPLVISSLLNLALGLAMIFISIGTNYYNSVWFGTSLVVEVKLRVVE